MTDVQHFHAAYQRIGRLITDPWAGCGDGQGGGNYDGSWAPSVPLPTLPEALEHLGAVDYAYISHLHPDHYSPEFLQAYLALHPTTRLLISDEPRLNAAIRRDGFGAYLAPCPAGTTILRHPVDEIDSALVVVAGDYAIVHLNDCRYNEQHVAQIKRLCGSRPITAFLPYLGAGEYPQVYEMPAAEMTRQATQKRLAFKRMYCQFVDALQPHRAIPIAGESEYVGPNALLNPLRGLPLPSDAALWRLQGQALYYGDTIDLVKDALVPNAVPPWEPAPPRPFEGYRYERDFVGIAPERLEPLLRNLAIKAAHNLLARQTLAKPYWLAVGTPTRCYTALDLSGRWGVRPAMAWEEVKTLGEPREEIEVDPRALYGALTGLYNWNTLAGGAHLRCRRTPLDAYEEKIFYEILPRLHV